MYIGYMRNAKEPTNLAKLTALKSREEGIELLYIRPRDVDIENNKVKASKLSEDNWEVIETEIPKFIDVTPYCFKRKNKKVMDYLKDNATLSYKPLKLKQQDLLKTIHKNAENHELLAPKKENIKQFHVFKDFIDDNKNVVVFTRNKEDSAPYIIHTEHHNSYIIERQAAETLYTVEELESLFYKVIRKQNYQIYKYFATDEKPILCRVHIQRSNDKDWKLVNSYIIQNADENPQMTESVNQNKNPLQTLLTTYHSYDSILIYEKVTYSIYKLADMIESITESKLMILGLNLCVSNKGEVYIYDILYGPSTSEFEEESAELRAYYYKDMFKNDVSTNSAQNKHKLPRRGIASLVNLFQKA